MEFYEAIVGRRTRYTYRSPRRIRGINLLLAIRTAAFTSPSTVAPDPARH
jgi:hypothetical protein